MLLHSLLSLIADAAAEPVSTLVPTEPPIVVAARAYLGRSYRFGARGTELDCMGLVFRAWTDVTGRSWRALSVNPTEIVAKRQLGAPVPGLDGVSEQNIDWELLRPGDVLFLLAPSENPAEPSLVTVDGNREWVWHMGIWSGGPARSFIVGDHYAGAVVEVPLPDYLERTWYDGVFVVR